MILSLNSLLSTSSEIACWTRFIAKRLFVTPYSYVTFVNRPVSTGIPDPDEDKLWINIETAYKLNLSNIDTQLILLEDSVQALNNYKNQLNQVILEIQTEITIIQNSQAIQ